MIVRMNLDDWSRELKQKQNKKKNPGLLEAP